MAGYKRYRAVVLLVLASAQAHAGLFGLLLLTGLPAEVRAQTEADVLHVFDGTDGAGPRGGLTEGHDGMLYGTTAGPGRGTIFRLAPDGSAFQTLYVFGSTGVPSDGAAPSRGRLVEVEPGSFVGTTSAGGAHGYGTLYRLNVSGATPVVTVLRSFDERTRHPDSGVVLGSNGLLYGTTLGDFVNNHGTVYRVASDGSNFTVLHTLAVQDGSRPSGGLIEASNGWLYGTTQYGGTGGGGTVFRIGFDGSGFERLVELEGHPVAGVTEAPGPAGAPVLYGVETGGGAAAPLGSIFRLDLDGLGFQRIGRFTGTDRDGAAPRSPLLLGRDGHLYGTASAGGQGCETLNCGTVFRVLPTGAPYAIHLFTIDNGGTPDGALVLARDGHLYGTASVGGTLAAGTGTGEGVVWTVRNPGTVPLVFTGPANAFEGGGVSYFLRLDNTTTSRLPGPFAVDVSPSAGLQLAAQPPATGWTCTVGASGPSCVWPSDLPPGAVTDTVVLSFDVTAPFSANCGIGPSPCVTAGARLRDRGVTVHVAAPVITTSNAHPLPADDAVFVVGNLATTVNVLENDADPDADTLSLVEIVVPPGAGHVTFTADGSVTYAPFAPLTEPDTFRYRVSDGRGATATALVTVTPRIPTLSTSKTRVDIGRVAVGRVAAGRTTVFSDAEISGPVRFEHVSPQELQAALAGTGYDPADAVSDPDAFRTLYGWVAYSHGAMLIMYYRPLTVGRVSVARAVLATDIPGLESVTRSLIIVGAAAEPATAPLRATDDTATTPSGTPVVIEVLANDGGESGGARPLYVSMSGACPSIDFFAGICSVQGPTLGGSITAPPSIRGPQPITVLPLPADATGTVKTLYASSELEACFDEPGPGGCLLEGNMYFATVTVNVGGAPPNLQAEKLVYGADGYGTTSTRVNAGDAVVFQVRATNQAAAGEPAVGPTTGPTTITDILPDGLSFAPGGSDRRCTAAGQTVTCVEPAIMNPGTAVAFDIATVATTAIPRGSTRIVNNVATVFTAGDRTASDNTSSPVTVTIANRAQADLRATIAISPLTVLVGEAVTVTATVTNLGPDPAHGVELTGLEYLFATHFVDSVVASAGGCDDPTLVTSLQCGLGTLAVGASATVTVVTRSTAAVFADFTQVQTSVGARVRATTDDIDPVPANDEAYGAYDVRRAQADVSVSLSTTPVSVLPGEPVTITATVSNAGPDAATSVTLTDFEYIVATHTIDRVTPSQGTCLPAVPGQWLQCALGTIASGGSATLVLVVRPTMALFPDEVMPEVSVGVRAEVSAAEQDSVLGNNRTNQTFAVRRPRADLSVNATTIPGTVLVGEPVTITATVTNNGPDAATGVTLTGLDYVIGTHTIDSVTPSQGTCGAVAPPAPLQCALGSLAAGASATVTVVARPTSAVFGGSTASTISVGLRARVSATEQDPVQANNEVYRAYDARRAQADVAVSMTSSRTSVAVGEPVVITVVVTNLGPQAATGVALTGFQEITLFENLTMSTTQGRCPTLFALGQPVGCALGTLAPGASATVTIAATAASQLFAGAIGSSVTVTVGGTLTANEVDPQPGNNAVSAALVVVWPPDVAPSNGRFTTAASSVPVGLAVVGDTLNFRVTVSNAGGPTSGPVTVSTALAGMVPVNLPPSCSAAAPSVVSCTIAALAPGASTEVGFWLTIGADAVSGPLPTPVPATTTVSTPGELRTTDNTTQTVLTIVNRPNLRVRTASFTDRSHRPIAFARVGDVVIFEVEIENVGQVASRGVDVVLRMDYGLVDRGGFCPAPTAAGPTARVCDTSYIGAGQSTRVSVAFEIQPSALPSGQTSVLLPASATILDLSSNTGQAALTVMDRLRPDLRVSRASFTTLTGAPVTTARVGDIVIFEVEIENVGNQRSASLRLDVGMYGGVVVRGGTCGSPGTRTAFDCSVPPLDPGQSRLERVAYRIEHSVPQGHLSAVLTAMAEIQQVRWALQSDAESNLSNNTGSASLIVSSQ